MGLIVPDLIANRPAVPTNSLREAQVLPFYRPLLPVIAFSNVCPFEKPGIFYN